MKIRMTESIRGTLNGVTVDDLVSGLDYETVNSPLGERMGRALIAKYAAIELDADGNPIVVELPPEPAPEVEHQPEIKEKARRK